MKARHQRRTPTVAGVLGALLAAGVTVPAPASAATGYAATARTGGTALNLRRTPSSVGVRVGSVPNGGQLNLACRVTAALVKGTVRTTNQWDRLTGGAYVSDAYVVRKVSLPVCPPTATPAPTAPAPPARPDPAPPIPAARTGESWQRPVSAGLVSGFRTLVRPAHDGVDLSAARFTPILAAAAGTVIRVVCNVSAGTCDVDGNRTLRGCGWYVEVQHAGNLVTRYCHMVRKPVVAVGQTVARGQLLGHVGTSGSSSGPHLHFEVHVNAAPATHANAVDPTAFLRSRGVLL